MHWFRFWSKSLDCPKVQNLDGETFKGWVNLLCLASIEEKHGRLPGIQSIGWRMRLTPSKARKLVGRLVDLKLIDRDNDCLTIHDWSKWQSKDETGNERVRRWREKAAMKKKTVRQFSPAEEAQIQLLKSMPYEQYLETEHWLNVRAQAIDAASGRCSTCNTEDQINVHHRSYERIGCELLSDLTVLCHNCHQIFHENSRIDEKREQSK